MPKFTVNSVVICDDVRKEVNGKDILIGVYGGSIIVQSLPVNLPIAVWVELTPAQVGHLEIDMKIHMPSNPTEFRMRYIVEVVETNASLPINTPQLMGGLSEAGDIEVSIKASDEEDWMLVKSKRVFVAEPKPASLPQFLFGPPPERSSNEAAPTASPPPSEQSQPDAPATAPRASRRRPSGRRTGRTPAPE